MRFAFNNTGDDFTGHHPTHGTLGAMLFQSIRIRSRGAVNIFPVRDFSASWHNDQKG